MHINGPLLKIIKKATFFDSQQTNLRIKTFIYNEKQITLENAIFIRLLRISTFKFILFYFNYKWYR